MVHLLNFPWSSCAIGAMGAIGLAHHRMFHEKLGILPWKIHEKSWKIIENPWKILGNSWKIMSIFQGIILRYDGNVAAVFLFKV